MQIYHNHGEQIINLDNISPHLISYYSISLLRCDQEIKAPMTARHGESLLQNRPLFQAICPGYLWARDKRWLLSRVQRLAGPTWGTWAFCPGWSHQPGQKAPHLSRLVAPPVIKGSNPFIPGGNTNRDKRVTLLSRLVLPTRSKGPST